MSDLAVMCPCGHEACYHGDALGMCAGSGDLTAPPINQPNVWKCRCLAKRSDVVGQPIRDDNQTNEGGQ